MTTETLPLQRERRRPKTSFIALTCLVVVTAVWGATFVVVKDVTRNASPMDFLAIRFLIASAVLAAVRPRKLSGLSRAKLVHGVLLGLVLAAAFIGQVHGQQYTTASMSGFLSGLAVVLTPVLAGLVLRNRIGRATWAAIGLATTGLALMSVRGLEIGLGEGLTLLCAFFLAVHIVGLSEWSTSADAYALTVVQLGVVGLLCLALGAPDGLDVPARWDFWLPVLGLAVLATAAAFLAQTWAQAKVSASAVAIVLTLEPLFAGVFGVLLHGDEVTVRIVAGGLLIIAAMYLAEFRSRPVNPPTSREGEQG